MSEGLGFKKNTERYHVAVLAEESDVSLHGAPLGGCGIAGRPPGAMT